MVYISVPNSSSADLPLHNANANKARRRFAFIPGRYANVALFLATAALSGVLFHLVVFGGFSRPWNSYTSPPPELAVHTRPVDYSPLPPHHDIELDDDAPWQHGAPTRPSAPVVPQGMAIAPSPDYHELSLEEIRDMVSRTRGFFARDFSLGLGWNNMRYIIEAALIQAHLLNRTLVLPSFVYARGCEYPIDVCAEYAPMVNKGDAVGWEEWRKLPIEKQMGWRVPMSFMLNITKIREKQPVALISDYLRLHGIDPEEERSNGAWHRDFYHSSASVFEPDRKPSLFVVENWWYDPAGVTRVDSVPDDVKARGQFVPETEGGNYGQRGHWPEHAESLVSQRLTAALPDGKTALDFDEAKKVLKDGDTGAVWDLSTDEQLVSLLQKNGWEVLHTFRSSLTMDYDKTVVNPLRQVVRRASLRGWADEYTRETADVLVLAGETHLYRKPGAMRFSTEAGMRLFQDFVLNYLVPIDAVNVLAERLATRMYERVEGRLWMGAHMRRGDFVDLGWAMEHDPEAHVVRVKDRLSRGRTMVEQIKSHGPEPYDIPHTGVSIDLLERDAPWATDPFYVATDERGADALDIISSNGAVFLTDLLTMDDLREFGWPMMLTDFRALVEQHLLAHAVFFYAHAMSSVAGGIVNMRANAGADKHTALLD